ncbi:hypothetical protein Bca4012_045323 [Brassica carinata]|uniref:Uncharacterized protein n=1 Tax=Brassica carinata TaxID=52824 RepID=A0A8X7UDI2_BRACI|nr:hypothetical protein Bca52824_057267 [Brassica carinata]
MKQKERVSTEPSRADITMNEIGIYTMKMRSGGVRTLKVDSVHTSPHRLVDSPEGNTTTRHRTPEPINISQDQTYVSPVSKLMHTDTASDVSGRWSCYRIRASWSLAKENTSAERK